MKIVANLATYPPRRDALPRIVQAIVPQVDQLNIVLNEYDAVPEELAGLDGVNPILPEEDTKDVGKFYPPVSGDYTLLIDDDIIYPPDYVARTVARFEQIATPRAIGGYHTSTYRLPRPWRGLAECRRLLAFRWDIAADYRVVHVFFKGLEAHLIVDQVASGCCILRSQDMPPYAYMRDSRKFVDVRLAAWCFEQGIQPVALPRTADWLKPVDYDETIFDDFTSKNPPHVSAEIRRYAFRVPGRNRRPTLPGSEERL